MSYTSILSTNKIQNGDILVHIHIHALTVENYQEHTHARVCSALTYSPTGSSWLISKCHVNAAYLV